MRWYEYLAPLAGMVAIFAVFGALFEHRFYLTSKRLAQANVEIDVESSIPISFSGCAEVMVLSIKSGVWPLGGKINVAQAGLPSKSFDFKTTAGGKSSVCKFSKLLKLPGVPSPITLQVLTLQGSGAAKSWRWGKRPDKVPLTLRISVWGREVDLN
jgi:hypothetical protein